MKTKLRQGLVAIALALITQLAYPQKIVVYFADYNEEYINNVQWDQVTHMVYSFLNPMDNTGNMVDASGNYVWGSTWFTQASFETAIARARLINPNIKIIISSGGAPGTDANITTRLNGILASGTGAGTAGRTFADDIIQFIAKYDIDGWDFDLEHPKTTAEKNNHETFVAYMKTRLNTLETTECRELELSIAVNGETNQFVIDPSGGDYVNPGVMDDIDFLHLMTYDASTANGWGHHAPLAMAQEAVYTFSAPPFNCAKSKMVVGVPFYGKVVGTTTASEYRILNSGGSAALYNADATAGYTYNGCPTIQAKIDFAKSEGLAGLLVWEVTQDLLNNHTYSLLKCMYNYTQSSWGSWPYTEQTCCAKPNLGNDKIVCNTNFDITLNAGTTGGTYVWKKLPSTTLSSNTSTQSITSSDGVGTYVVTRTETVGGVSCSRSDTIDIIATLPNPNLGSPRTLCNPASVTLTPTNASDFPAATTWQWQKNTVNITGATTNSLYVNSAGTYTLVANLSGCTQASGSVVVSGTRAVGADACRTSAGTFTLSVSGGTGPFTWYSADFPSTASVGTGTSITTGSLSSTTTYYVEDQGAASNFSVGVSSAGIPNGSAYRSGQDPVAFDGTFPSMEFQVTSPLKIKSVDMWAYSDVDPPFPIVWKIEIYNSSNTLVYTSPNQSFASAPTGTWQTVTLNANLDPGKYRIRAVHISGSTAAKRIAFFHNTPTAFPYTGGTNNISITKQIGVINQVGPFYNWQIADFQNCDRIPVRAVIAASCDGFLPVNFSHFDVYKENGDVNLEWATASEENNDYFEVERSEDGIHFTSIGRVEGNGTTSELNNYYFTDYNAPSTTLYYRLAQYDIDRTVHYSAVKIIDNRNGVDLTVVPNPFNSSATLKVAGIPDTEVEVRITDINGKLVSSFNYNSNQEVVFGSDLVAGFYIVQVVSENSVVSTKLIKE